MMFQKIPNTELGELPNIPGHTPNDSMPELNGSFTKRGYRRDLDMLRDYFRLIDYKDASMQFISTENDKHRIQAVASEQQINRNIDKAKPASKGAFLLSRFQQYRLRPEERLLIACMCYYITKPGDRHDVTEVYDLVCDGDRVRMIEFRAFLNNKTKLFEAGLLQVSVKRSAIHKDRSISLSTDVRRHLWGLGEEGQVKKNDVGGGNKKNQQPTIAASPKDMYEALSKYVVGQEAAKRVISVAMYNHFMRINGESDISKANILMAGPTGCGKTYLVETLSRILDVPLVVVDASQYSETGYVGRDISEILDDLLRAAGNDPDKAARGVIFIDEIDKIAAASDNGHHRSNRDVSGEAVQAELLKLVDGGECAGLPFDTSNVLFIAGGAFSSLVEDDHASQRRAIGFETHASQKEEKGHPHGLMVQDLCNYGMLPELMGRFQLRVFLERLTMIELKRLLSETENSIIGQYQKLFKTQGLELVVPDDTLTVIAQKAVLQKTGARGLKSVIENTLNPIMFQYFGADAYGKTITVTPTMAHIQM